MKPGEFLPLVAEYGYVATFVGMLLEGETFLVLSGVAAYGGLLDMPVLFAIGTTGAMLSDNLFFAAGRVLGPALLTRFSRLASPAARVQGLVERLPNTAVIGIRFIYGMRAVGPAVIGAGSMPWSRFVVLDALAASLWAVCWISVGYLLGESADRMLGAFTEIGRWMIVGIGVGSAITMLVLHRRRRKLRRASGSTDA